MNHPIYILEGPDGAGKTTLAESIGGHYIHATYDKKLTGHMTQYHLDLLTAAHQLAKYQPVCIDRWRMSEEVYGKVFRSGPEDPEIIEYMYRTAVRHGGIFVNCLPANREVYLQQFNKLRLEREEMFSNMEQVYDRYVVEIDHLVAHGFKAYTYDRHHETPEGFAKFLRENASLHDKRR